MKNVNLEKYYICDINENIAIFLFKIKSQSPAASVYFNLTIYCSFPFSCLCNSLYAWGLAEIQLAFIQPYLLVKISVRWGNTVFTYFAILMLHDNVKILLQISVHIKCVSKLFELIMNALFTSTFHIFRLFIIHLLSLYKNMIIRFYFLSETRALT